MRERRNLDQIALALLLIAFAVPAGAASVRDLPARAIRNSQLTLPGSVGFHLVATVADPKNPSDQEHTARIEESWVSPQKWRRTVTAPGFSQLLIVNGSQTRGEMTGDYYPNWLRSLVNAIFDPGAPIQNVDLTKSDDNPVLHTNQFCRRFATEVGIAPVSNEVFSSYCFVGDLLDSVVMPGYTVKYTNYSKFSGKRVARTVEVYIRRDSRPEARITELTTSSAPDDSLFAIAEPRPPVQTVFFNEKDALDHAIDPSPMRWPKVEEGQLVGVASIYVCIDRAGRVRETYALNNDHPDIAEAARQQLMSWKFRPFTSAGAAVQADTILTFAYETQLISPASH